MDESDAVEIAYDTVLPALQPATMAQIRGLLARQGLDPEAEVDTFCVGRQGQRVLACAGLAHDVVKCTAIAPAAQGLGVLERLMTELTYAALDRGVSHLFLYTSLANEEKFLACGFHRIVAVPDEAQRPDGGAGAAGVVFMENSRAGITKWTEELSYYRRQRPKVGAVVVNCNPFTLGHRYLLQQAAQDCDYLHVFVVSEDASFFSYADRLALVHAGVAELPERDRIHVHPGSRYLVSKATFPTYFLKDAAVVQQASTAVDLRIFREHIAPSLGITHRYVGTEPFCAVTRAYNADMHRWVEQAHGDHDPVRVVEVERVAHEGRAISATQVRRRIIEGRLAGLDRLVPAATYAFIIATYGTPEDKARATAATTAASARAYASAGVGFAASAYARPGA